MPVQLTDATPAARKLRMCLLTRADYRGMTSSAHRNVRRARNFKEYRVTYGGKLIGWQRAATQADALAAVIRANPLHIASRFVVALGV